jgi:hypothetical protein
MITEKTRLQLANLLVDNTSCGGQEADKVIPMILSLLDEAGGIASYYTSPLALREEYKLETGGDIEGAYYSLVDRDKKIFDSDYVQWLESKLVRQAGE